MKRRTAFAAALALILISTGASAQPVADHLQCFKIKDSETKAKYTATLTANDPAFLAAPGCTVKVPAKYLCVDTVKSAVTPTPPGAPGADTNAQNYLCYKTKCPKMEKTLWAGQDQFGSRAVRAIKTGLVCAPASPTGNGCNEAAECPGSDTECSTRTCTDGICGTTFVSPGTPTTTQTAGDCQQTQCNGEGGTTSVTDDNDTDDLNACTTDSCLAGVPAHTPVAPASECPNGLCFGTTCIPTS